MVMKLNEITSSTKFFFQKFEIQSPFRLNFRRFDGGIVARGGRTGRRRRTLNSNGWNHPDQKPQSNQEVAHSVARHFLNKVHVSVCWFEAPVFPHGADSSWVKDWKRANCLTMSRRISPLFLSFSQRNMSIQQQNKWKHYEKWRRERGNEKKYLRWEYDGRGEEKWNIKRHSNKFCSVVRNVLFICFRFQHQRQISIEIDSSPIQIP